MESAAAHSFEQEWPALAARLSSMLARRSIPAFKRDDIVQETGLRLFRMWDEVDEGRPTWPLTVTIALNLMRDEARRRPEREIIAEIPDLPDEADVERAGLARLELLRVRRAMNKLSPDHRSVLMVELGGPTPGDLRGGNATKMLRMRARRKLTALLETASASGALAMLKLRRLLGFEQVIWARASATSHESGVISIAAGLIGALAISAVPIVTGLTGPPRVSAATPGAHSGSNTATTGVAVASVATDDVATLTSAARDARRAQRRNASQHRSHRNGSARRPGWAASEEELQPLRVSIPGGYGYVEVGVRASVFGIGGGTGHSNAGTPVCVQGTGQSMTGIECTHKRSGTGADMKGGADVLDKHVEVKSEVK